MNKKNDKGVDKKDTRKYYAAYDERYKTAHANGVTWSSSNSTPIIMDVLGRYNIIKNLKILEIGCGEGRDSFPLLKNGYNLLATDISEEAIEYCKSILPNYKNRFCIMDCLSDTLNEKYDFIFSIAVIHMLVLDEDRKAFLDFIYTNLANDGVALICTMGDGRSEMQTNISSAFELQERNHESGKMLVATTSCRMVSFSTFEKEIKNASLSIIEKGITESLPDFNSLMYVVVKKR